MVRMSALPRKGEGFSRLFRSIEDCHRQAPCRCDGEEIDERYRLLVVEIRQCAVCADVVAGIAGQPLYSLAHHNDVRQ